LNKLYQLKIQIYKCPFLGTTKDFAFVNHRKRVLMKNPRLLLARSLRKILEQIHVSIEIIKNSKMLGF